MGHTSRATLLACLFLASAPLSAETTGHIHGLLTDKAGNPLENVTVTLVGPTTTGRPTTTDENGEFRFMLLAPGVYTVWADEHRPSAAWRSVGVRVGSVTRVTLSVRTGDDEETECKDTRRAEPEAGTREPSSEPPARPAR